ncbi:hypothetical protein [Streptomyces sp. NPDC047043]|uniref:hypothetical protein n=1 Tax=Streptomyces sp. NPDC047043 TaxID=3154497 RepID=UPI0033EEBBBD
MAGLPILAAFLMALYEMAERARDLLRRTPRSPNSRFAVEVVSFAAALAGRRRNFLSAWLADLAGDPEDGIVLSRWQQRRLASGYVVAAVRMRLHDLAVPVWRPIDWLLAAESRTNAVITVAVGALVIYIDLSDGLHTLATEGWGWCAGCGGSLYMLFRWLRRIRGIEIANPSGPPHSGDD